MTSKNLECLNRRNRILDAARAGELYKEIAARERCGIRVVSRIAVKGGIRRRFRPDVVKG
jgi:hypothetical protein